MPVVPRVATLVLAAVLVGCNGSAADHAETEEEIERGPRKEESETNSDRIRLASTQVSPGDTLELTFPADSKENSRAVYLWLELAVEGTWDERYFAYAKSRDLSGPESNGRPKTVPTGEETGWDDVAVTGPGPDYVEVPDDAVPGRWRVCAPDADEAFCAPFEVVE